MITFTEYLEGIIHVHPLARRTIIAQKMCNEIRRIFESDKCYFRSIDIWDDGNIDRRAVAVGHLMFFPKNKERSVLKGWLVTIHLHPNSRTIKILYNEEKQDSSRFIVKDDSDNIGAALLRIRKNITAYT